MRVRSHIVALSCALALSCASAPALALETDQFTLPPQPLADIGPEVALIVHNTIQRVLDETNQQIRELHDSALRASSEQARSTLNRKIASLRSLDHVADRVNDALGKGFPKSRIEELILHHAFVAQPAVFKLPLEESILKSAGVVRPLLNVGLVPTINVYGVLQGTDKLAHFFQEGYDYLGMYQRHLRDGDTNAEALRAAVNFGRGEEAGVFGWIPSGAYSNADLAANYAGLIFYLNLTRPMPVAGAQRPPILLIDADGWRFNPASGGGTEYLRPYISDHFDEAMNPAEYDWTMRDSIRDEVRQRARQWMEFHHTTLQQEQQRLIELSTWHGADYGHSGFKKLITIANTCVDESAAPQPPQAAPQPALPASRRHISPAPRRAAAACRTAID